MSTIQNQSKEVKYSKGAKIILLISLSAIPIQLLTSMLISRVSPEAAGTLGVVELFYNAIVTFFLFGGETAIVKLLSDFKGNNSKKSFILYYIGICIGYFLVFAGVLRLLNIDIIKLIIGSNSNTSFLMYVVGVLIVLHNILLSFQKEQEQFLNYSIGVKLFHFVMLFATIFIFVNPMENMQNVFYYGMIISYILIIPVTIFQLNFSLPNIKGIKSSEYKFFKYTIFLHASTIVAFLFDRIDQILILNSLGVAVLGGYYLMFKVSTMVKLLPNIYNSTFYLYFCRELRKENANELCRSLLNRNLLVVVPIIFVVILNAGLIIQLLFGKDYLEFSNVLKIFMGIIIIGVPGMVLNNCLFALGRSKQYFVISTISVIVQLAVMFPLMSLLGVEGLVIAKGLTNVLIITMCLFYLKKEKYNIELPGNYFFYSIMAIFLILFSNLLDFSVFYEILITILFLVTYIYFNRASIKELIIR
ncbi:lipopolysaccharide biosynthesis protein [Guptibacillus hwajinpoensis]|uniref:Uncharacterized protein n=1 Tax=Guptibacillus hwajinpoensis TaxID=208199 RepID=A0A0J6CXI0_9BACL|nr:lipopolysaccharide biosynthesis protein [Alkalihalobacillus macyae]KMM36749.1 hypothetical protein AB986_12470 [Alkalihalobacillus macyae]